MSKPAFAPTRQQPNAASSNRPIDNPGRSAVLDFVRTPFTVRRNVVKVWRTIPSDLWIALSGSDEGTRARRVERRAVAGVALMAAALMLGFSGMGVRAVDGDQSLLFSILGKSSPAPEYGPTQAGWYFVPGRSLLMVFWVVVPSLLGWSCVRLIWIPWVAAGNPTRQATLNMARHLGSVYLYVYLMIIGGALLMVPLTVLAPRGTEMFRWCFWCFLFGESSFVPAVMWIRLILNDSAGEIFGRSRHVVMGLLVAMLVVVPIWGMTHHLRQALERSRADPDLGRPSTLGLMSDHAGVLVRQARYDDADALLDERHRNLKASRGGARSSKGRVPSDPQAGQHTG